MIKKALLASVLAVALSPAPVVAERLNALSVLQATPGPTQDAALAAPEEGATCDSSSSDSARGVSLCAWLESGTSSGTAHFTVTDELPVMKGARFLQVVN